MIMLLEPLRGYIYPWLRTIGLACVTFRHCPLSEQELAGYEFTQAGSCICFEPGKDKA